MLFESQELFMSMKGKKTSTQSVITQYILKVKEADKEETNQNEVAILLQSLGGKSLTKRNKLRKLSLILYLARELLFYQLFLC